MVLKLKDILNNRKAELLSDAPRILKSVYEFCHWCPCRRKQQLDKKHDKWIDVCRGYDRGDIIGGAKTMETTPCEFKEWFDKYKFVFPVEQ